MVDRRGELFDRPIVTQGIHGPSAEFDPGPSEIERGLKAALIERGVTLGDLQRGTIGALWILSHVPQPEAPDGFHVEGRRVGIVQHPQFVENVASISVLLGRLGEHHHPYQ